MADEVLEVIEGEILPTAPVVEEEPKMRNKMGQFVEGHKGISPGRPSRLREMHYQGIIESACSDEDFLAICVRAVRDAKKGNRWARDWYTDRLMGPISHYARLAITGEHSVLVALIERLVGIDEEADESTVADVETEEGDI